jgi:hypothetical protein
MYQTTNDKAKLYDSLLAKHDGLARKVSLIESNFNLTAEMTKEIAELKAEMKQIERKAERLVTG